MCSCEQTYFSRQSIYLNCHHKYIIVFELSHCKDVCVLPALSGGIIVSPVSLHIISLGLICVNYITFPLVVKLWGITRFEWSQCISACDSEFELLQFIFAWQCICMLTTWYVSLCLNWHNVYTSILSNVNVIMCVYLNHCVSVVTVSDYLSPSMSYASEFVSRCHNTCLWISWLSCHNVYCHVWGVTKPVCHNCWVY